MNIKKIPFIIPQARQATSTDAFTAKTKPWNPKDVVVIDQVAVCNNDNNNTLAHVGVIRDEFAIYYETLVLAKKEYFYCTKSPVVMPSGYRVIIKFDEHASGDSYYFNIMGHLEVCMKE